MVTVTTTHAQIKNGIYVGIGKIYGQNKVSGDFELGAPLEPIGDRGKFQLIDRGMGIKAGLGYGKIIHKFYFSGELSADFISSQKKSKGDGNWNFSIENGIGFDASILMGILMTENHLIYGKLGFIPYSRYTISADHNSHGRWEDHNFFGYNFGIGSRVNIGRLDLKLEIKYNHLDFNQPLKDGAASSQCINQWDFEIGLVLPISSNY